MSKERRRKGVFWNIVADDPYRKLVAGGLDVLVEPVALVLEIVADGRGECRIRQPVMGPRRDRIETAAQLVFPLCARLEACHACLDAVFYRLVETGLEMEAVVAIIRAPVPSVERRVTAEEDRACNRFLAAHRHQDPHRFAHR